MNANTKVDIDVQPHMAGIPNRAFPLKQIVTGLLIVFGRVAWGVRRSQKNTS